MQKLRGLFGGKASLAIALRADADQRSAERWLAGTHQPNAENFAALIRSDVGADVLATVMGDDEQSWPQWYAGLKRQMKLSALRASLVDQQRALEALEKEGAR